MIIAMSGFARSGKDAAADHLVEKHGFVKLAFADILRDVLYALNPVTTFNRDGTWTNDDYNFVMDQPTHHVFTVQQIIDEYGWDNYKESPFGDDIRRLLQRLGTEAGRDTLGKNVWIDATLRDLDPEKDYVISDARFLNEFKAVEDLGGVVLRVNREGVGPANDHPSEIEALQYDFKFIIHNNSDLDSYLNKVDRMLEILQGDYAGCRR